MISPFTYPQYPEFVFTAGERHKDECGDEYYQVVGKHPDGRRIDADAYFTYSSKHHKWMIDFLVNEEETPSKLSNLKTQPI